MSATPVPAPVPVNTPRSVPTPATEPETDVLRRTWDTPPGLWNWITAVNHRAIGKRYIVTGFIFFVLGGISALLMRLQLLSPENTFLDPALYNQLMTMHGTTMMFLFAVPIMEGIGIYFVPLMIGSRDMSFPRLNAFGYWVYLFAGVVMYISLLMGQAPDGGWFSYVPLALKQFSPGLGIDFYATMITFLEVAALVAAVELVVTIFKMRAPGMTLSRMPVFVWSILIMSFMIIFAMPPLMVGSVQLALDRTVGSHFFNPQMGGDPLLWQHLFWFFGHPEVYIIFVPALGIISAIIPAFTGRPLVGYILVVLSLLAIGVVSFGLWVHHMFAVGLPWLAFSFFTVASVMIAIPSGIQIVSALTTMWLGKLVLKTPMLYVIGFVIVFVLGGLTGVMLAVVPFNLQTHDTYFVVAHFHYVLIGGAVFPLFGGFFYWFPKITGRLLNETLGKLQFWLFFIGFNVAFLPMHLTGFLGMPRRVYTYLPGLGWDGLNVISTIGAFMIAASILLFIAIVAIGLRRGEAAGDNPWNAGTLEWATASPPPPYNFRDVPVVHSREPLWDEQPVFPRDAEAEHTQVSLHGHDRVDRFGLRDSRREALGSTTLDAIPEQRVQLARPSIKPLLTAFAVAFTFLAVMIDLVLVPVGAVLVFASIVAWHWPEKKDFTDVGDEDHVPDALPSSAVIGSMGGKSPVWLGMVLLVLIEAVVFASLISSYLYLRSKAEIWPLDGLKAPDLLLPTLNAVLLIASVVPMHLADRGIRKGNQNQLRLGLIAGFVMAAVFLGIKVYEYSNLDYNWATNAYGSMVWTITGFHSAHVLALLLKTFVIIVLAFLGYFTSRRYVGVTANSLYWYFVVAVWIPLFALLYLLPNFL